MLNDTLIDKIACYQIRLIPKPNAAVLWSRIELNVYLKLITTHFTLPILMKMVNWLTHFMPEKLKLRGRMLPFP